MEGCASNLKNIFVSRQNLQSAFVKFSRRIGASVGVFSVTFAKHFDWQVNNFVLAIATKKCYNIGILHKGVKTRCLFLLI